DYNLTLNDNTVAPGLSLTVDGSGLSATSELILNGAAETNGQLVLTGGAGDDTLTGGARTDTITGGLGADKITGGGGSDIIVYNATAESTGLNYDTVDGFFFSRDQFDLATAVTGVDAAVTTGALSAATFNADLATALDALHLGQSHAVLFTANSGSLAGHTFLVVDQNGIAGYQANLDLVVELTHVDHANSISTASFI
ncbi:MAG TPA: bluetail domain-containing putative surface protein, partial [Rhizomicrobium sp.]|nr:bluetail domain-containing putative surface protein [Rhizomicrobium sp.]